MKKNLLLLLPIFLVIQLKAQWVSQTSPSTNNFYSVFSIDANAVGIAGTTGLLRTGNGGLNWAQNVTLGGVNCFELHTRNPFRWYALTQNSSWYLRMGNPAGVTLNSGKPDSILSLHYINMACGIAVGTAGKIEATCDTGATWQLRTSGTNNNLNAIWFADADTGCAVGAGGTIIRTTNAGNTWQPVVSGTALSLNAIHFPNPSVGYISGNGGKLLKTMDAGATWTNMPTGVLNTLNGVFFVDSDTGYVVGSGGLIMKTLDGGVNWYNMTSGTSNVLNSVHFSSPVDGWAVGNAGTILKYNGSSGLGIKTNEESLEFLLYPNPAKDFISFISHVSNATIKIYNALGALVYEGISGGEETKLDIRDFSAGVYFAEWRTTDKVLVKKFVKN